MLSNRHTISIYSFWALFMLLPASLLFLYFFHLPAERATASMIWFLSALGWVEYLFCLWLWKKKTDNLFSPYVIIFSFAFIFHYGQCLMWALGTHLPQEIGMNLIFGSITAGQPAPIDIIHTQALCLMGLYVFHCGALLISSKLNFSLRQNWLELINTKLRYKQSLLIVSTVAFLVCMPAAIYNEVYIFTINQTFGYGASLYNPIVQRSGGINVLGLLTMMYFASMAGMLLASNYKKIFIIFSYGSFVMYSVLCLMAGDRGEFLFPFIFLLWMHNTLYKQLNFKKVVGIAVLAICFIILFVGIRNVRNNGMNLEVLVQAISIEANPIASAVFELGNTMSIPLVLLKNGWNIYPFGNTYLLGMGGMITSKWIYWLIPNYAAISTWFSQEYLRIAYGAGFSMIAEALVNYGPYLALLWLFFLGMAYARVTRVKIREKTNILTLFIQITTAEALILSVRNTIGDFLKFWFFSTCMIAIAVYIFDKLNKR